MTRLLLTLGLLGLSSLAQAGEFTLSPASIGVARGQHSIEVAVSYTPAAGVTDAQVDLRLSLDQLGWVQAHSEPSPTPAYETLCVVAAGQLTALVASRNLAPLPSGVPIPLCRFRVRPPTNASTGLRVITPTSILAYASDAGPVPATANSVYVVVR
jgi:hypothetical protein